MAPLILLLLPALFFSVVIQIFPSHCIMDSTSTTLEISQATELNAPFPINPTLSLDSISGGHNFICSLRSGNASFFCWDGIRQRIKHVYSGPTVLSGFSVGARHVAAIDGDRLKIRWWRYGNNWHAQHCRNLPKSVYGEYHCLASGHFFTCVINGAHIVHCWGPRAELIQRSFAGVEMRNLTAGGGRMCGLNMTGHPICTGNQPNVPSGEAFDITSLAIGGSHTCSIRRENGTDVCWGRYGSYFPMGSTGFEFLVAGCNLSCGLTTEDFDVARWGLNVRNLSAINLSMPKILPGASVPDETFCSCGVYPESGDRCGGSGVICKRSDTGTTNSCPFSAITEMRHGSSLTIRETLGKLFVYAILGIVLYVIVTIGMNICTKWLKLRWCGVNNISALPQQEIDLLFPSIPTGFTFPVMDNVQVFSINELKTATNNFSRGALVGGGGFGIVYCGRLSDGCLVAVKCCYTTDSGWESVFKAELETLATTCHVNVISLIGYCTDAPLCVFEFMPNKDLHKHIHPGIWPTETRLLYSWKLRVKVLLDAARGIEYLHRYAEPRIIHRDIKSSNILLDENWVAKISDFGLAVFGPEPGRDHVKVATAIGTAGYLDPDCNPYFPCITPQSDVYSFGVVMLEVLTGQRAYNTSDDSQLAPFAAPKIAAGKLMEVLDKRLVLPEGCEMDAVENVAQLAVDCTRSGLERPNMSIVVTELESAVALFDQLN